MAKLGDLYIISAPSGAGKTSLVAALMAKDDKIKVSISHTTRDIRPGESNGDNYFFIDKSTFQQMIQQDAFLEHAQVFGNYYGTSVKTVHDMRQAGLDVILEIDWQGARQVKNIFADAIGIFILPPSQATLANRLRNRGQDTDETISQRMQEAVSEMSHYDEYEYIIINKDFEIAVSELQAIFCTNRLRMQKQAIENAALLKALLSEEPEQTAK